MDGMPLKKIRDLAVYYEAHGEGTPLVLVAGFGCDHTFWSGIVDALTPHFEVFIFDNRAMGRSRDAGDAFTVDTLAEDTVHLVKALGLKKSHFLGQSMGGAVVQTVAANFPRLVDRLIIMNSAAKFNERTLQALRGLVHLAQIGVAPKLLLDAAMPWFFSPYWLSHADNCEAFRQIVLSSPLQSPLDQARQLAAIEQFDATPWLQKIVCPSLVVSSEEDIVSLPDEGRFLAKKLSKGKFHLLPGGHASPIEQPRAVADLAVKFLTT